MKEYNEQVVEKLDDAASIIANKNIIIDNLQARIAELEGDVAIERASRKYWEDAYSEWINTDKAAQGLIAKDVRIAELEAENERLKAELAKYRDAPVVAWVNKRVPNYVEWNSAFTLPNSTPLIVKPDENNDLLP